MWKILITAKLQTVAKQVPLKRPQDNSWKSTFTLYFLHTEDYEK